MPLRLVLPLPPPELHAHAKGVHWAKKAAATKRLREVAYVEAMGADVAFFMGKAVLSIDFYFPDLIQRDTLNFVQGIKPYIDGIVDAGTLTSDDWRYLSIGHIRAHLDRENPCVVLTVEETKDD